MKKSKNFKIIAISMFALVLLLVGSSVNAASAFLEFTVPRFQGFFYTDSDSGSAEITGASASSARVYGEVSTLNAITFYGGHCNNNYCGNASKETYAYASAGTVFYAPDHDELDEDWEFNVNYEGKYANGQLMGVKVRNHTWALSSGRFVGTINYH